MKLQTESVNCTVNPLCRCTAKSSANHARWTERREECKVEKDHRCADHTGETKDTHTYTSGFGQLSFETVPVLLVLVPVCSNSALDLHISLD